MDRIRKYYSDFSESIFFIYIIGVMSFGRIFAINHFKVGKIPLFVTEIILVMCCPYVFMNFYKLLKLPKVFLFTAGAFFSIGIFHLISGLWSGNLFALRDAVLSVYMVFVLISYLVFLKSDNLKNFLKFLIVGNVLAIAIFKFYLFLVIYPSIGDISDFFSRSNLAILKGFNFGIYCNIFIAFILSFCGFLKKTLNKLLILLLLSFNVYIVVAMDSRSTFIAFCINIVFLLLVLRGRYLKNMIGYFLVSFVLVAIFYYADFNISKISSFKNHGSRFTTIITLAKRLLVKERTAQIRGVNPAKETNVDKVVSVDEEKKLDGMNISGEEGSVQDKERVADATICDGITAKGAGSRVQCPEWTKKRSFITDYMKKIVKTGGKARVLSQNEAYSSAYWRLVVDVQAIDFGLQAPVFGKGFGVYPDYRLAQNQKMTELNEENFALSSRVISPHNHIIAVFMKMGFVGLALFLFMNIYVFVVGFGLMKKCNNEFTRQYIVAVLGSLVSWHALALLFDVIDAPMTNIFLWIFFGMIFAIGKQIDTDHTNNDKQYETNF